MTARRAGPSWPRRSISLVLAAYMGVVFVLSHQPRPPLPDYLKSVSDKLLHAVEYFPLGFLWVLRLGPNGARRALIGWGVATLFGLTDELHQAFVPGRDSSALDVLADSLGAAAGACAAVLWAAVRRRRGAEGAR